MKAKTVALWSFGTFFIFCVAFLFLPVVAPSLAVRHSPLTYQVLLAGSWELRELEKWTAKNYSKEIKREVALYLSSKDIKLRRSAIRCYFYWISKNGPQGGDKATIFGLHQFETDKQAKIDIVYLYGLFQGEDIVDALLEIAKVDTEHEVRQAALGSLMSFSHIERVVDFAREYAIKYGDKMSKVEKYYCNKIMGN
jgi:hypothetical protein